MSNGVEYQTKIDPRLRRDAKSNDIASYLDKSGRIYWLDHNTGRPRSTPSDNTDESRQDRYVQVFIEVADPATAEHVKAHSRVKHFVNVVDGYCTATVGYDAVEVLAAFPGVMEIEGARFVRPTLDQSVDRMHGWDGMRGDANEVTRLGQGSGVLIGIVDYGLDFTLDDFRDPTTKDTRVEYLWDQQLTPEGQEISPAKYGYGVEYSAIDIRRALAAPNPFEVVRHHPTESDSDVSGHGTHVAGIAAGNGRTGDQAFPAGQFVGVAPGAKLVFVHLDRKTVLAGVESAGGTLANSVNLAHAIAYCFEKAEQLNMPCVVNLSMGFNGGGHDGDMVIEWIIDALVRKSGRAVVIAAGNENGQDKGIYFGGIVPQGQSTRIEWENGLFLPTSHGVLARADPSPNEMEIWYSLQSSLRVRLLTPRKDEVSEWVQRGSEVVLEFDSGEHAIVKSDRRTAWEGAARIYIQLHPGKREKGIRAGIWVVELEATQVGKNECSQGVRYDAWIERTLPEEGSRHLRSRFKNYHPLKAITMTTPATARQAIAVASCRNFVTAAISDFSGCGPTRDGRDKPDVAAPGELVISTNADAGRGNPAAPARVSKRGTSMAAPHVSGIVARLLQRNHYLTADEIRKILVDSADPGTWERDWGNGAVNIAKAMKLLEGKWLA
ncbi:MAG: S8 family peptidase [Hyphomicrobiaceae bacterium]